MKDNTDLLNQIIWFNNDEMLYEEENEKNNICLVGKVSEYDNISNLYSIDIIYPKNTENKMLTKVQLPKNLLSINFFNIEEINKKIEIDNLENIEDYFFNEKLTYYILERFKKEKYFSKVNNNIILSYLNKKIFNFDCKIFNDFYQEFLKNTNKNLIFFGDQLSGKTSFYKTILKNFISKFPDSEQKLINAFEKGYELYKLFTETIDGHSRSNLLIQFIIKKDKIISIKFIPNSLMPVTYNNFYKIFHIFSNSLKKENNLNDKISKILKNENLPSIEDLNSYFSSLNIPNNEIKLFINSLFALIYLMNEDYKNFFTFLSIKDYDNNIKSYKEILIRFLYFKLFEWLIKKINSFLGNNTLQKNANEENKIFTFYDSMSFSKNMCCDLYDMIQNFSYEKIISLYNKYAINNILEEYKRENLNIQYSFNDNKEVIDLFEHKGIFDIINSKEKSKTDKSIYLNIYENLSKNISLGNKEDNFISINHSFGDIYYKYDGILKDNIFVTKEISILLSKSTNTIINKLEKNNNNEETIINYYLKQIKDFYSYLFYGNCYFIQNIYFSENNLELKLYNQIYSYSLAEIINFNQEKFYIKLTNKEFISIVKFFSSNIKNLIDSKKEEINSNDIKKIKNLLIEIFTTYLVENMELNKLLNDDEIQIGLSSIYFRKKGYEWMIKYLMYTKKIKMIQRNYRNYINNKKDKIEENKKYERKISEEKFFSVNSFEEDKPKLNLEKQNNNTNEKIESNKKPKKKSVLDILTQSSNDSKKEEKENSKIKNLKDEIKNLKNLQELNIKLQKENEQLKQRIKDLSNQVIKEEKEEEEIDYKNIIEELKKKITLLNNEIEEHKKTIDTQKKEIEKLSEEKLNMNIANEKLKNELIHWKNKYSSLENNNKENRISQEDLLANKQINQLKSELSRQKNINIKLTSNFNEEHEKYIKIKEDLDKKNNLLKDLENQLSEEMGNNNLLNKNNLLNRNRLIQNKRENKNHEKKISNLEDDIYNITGNIGLFKKALIKKNNIIKNKNKIIELLYYIIKNKNLEVQCYKMFKFVKDENVKNLKQKIIKIQEKEKKINCDINDLNKEENNNGDDDVIDYYEKKSDNSIEDTINIGDYDKNNTLIGEEEFVFDND